MIPWQEGGLQPAQVGGQILYLVELLLSVRKLRSMRAFSLGEFLWM
jgi:hypothetical protein